MLVMQVDIRNMSRLTLSIFGLGLAGCASMDPSPAWVRGEAPIEYSRRDFITAVGTGGSLSAAEIAAKSELSQIFSVSLESEIQLIDEESIVGDRSVQSSEMLVDTKISTKIELQGAEVPLRWRDLRNGEVWALAVLERRKECLRIRSEGADLTTRLAALLGDLESEANALVAVRSALKALGIGIELDELQARSRVLGSQCLSARSESTGALRTRVDRGVRALSFVVTAKEIDPRTGNSRGSLPQLRERIAGNLTKMGFQIGPVPGASVIPVRAQLRLSPVDRGTEWIEYRWEGSAEIGSPISGDSANIAVQSEGAESHPQKSTARLRARHSGELDLAKRLDRLLKAFLTEDGDG